MTSLLELAVKKSADDVNNDVLSADGRTLVFAGCKGAGKTTMILRFLEKNETAKETLALEYFYGRKSGRSLTKDICHIWEIGGGSTFSSLLASVLGSNLKQTTLLVILDLSSPKTLWTTLEVILQTALNHISTFGDSELSKASTDRVPDDHEDKNAITPFPVPLIIIGGKYDKFLNMDPEEKKLISRTLRLVAHSVAASLIYYSDHDASLVKKLKDVLNHYGFGSGSWKGFNTDPDKALCIPFGADSFQNISAQNIPHRSGTGMALERFKLEFTTHFPQETDTTTIPDDPAVDPNFREPIIDNLRAQKEEELDRITREKKNKEGFEIYAKNG